MAFVLVQHLDPRHESRLTDVLSRITALPVITVTEGLRAAPDSVYVIPQNTDMTIAHGAFRLTPRTSADHHMPIDHFFRSLALEQDGRAVGVVLSGTGSDGTLGLKAIKAEGGITFVQDEQSAKYAGMPRSALPGADFVLPPGEIAVELARIGHHPYVNPARPAPVGPGGSREAADVSAILRVLRTASGADFAQYKPASIRRRIARRMLLQKMDDMETYVRYLRQTPAEVQALYDDILIQVTGFFRDPDGFEALTERVFPGLVEDRAADEPIRIWVPGCATGEEAYSLVIRLLEFLGERDSNVAIQMFATDLSATAIARARAGTFPASIEGEVRPERLRRFFVKTDGRYQISKSIRDVCVFAQQDVTRDPPFSKLDLISCCNLLIYLDAPLQERVIPIFHYALKATGFLKLGPSESVGRFTSLFSMIDPKHKIYARKAGASAHAGFGVTGGSAAAVRAPAEEVGGSAATIEQEADRVILGRYAPAGVVVNADMEIVQFRGRTGPYLEATPGAASLDLFKMAREDLSSSLRHAVNQAAKGGGPVRTEGLRVKTNGETREIGLEVIPIGLGTPRRHYLILFCDERARSAPSAPGPDRTVRPKAAAERRIAQLTQELAAARQHLRAIGDEHEAATEELRAATEEAQSSNEELQSTNEELETSKEELQATNEELATVNDELNSRNAELGQLTNDLGNLLTSTHVPIIMVGTDRRIRRITPATERTLNVSPGDVGRPIGDLRLSVEVPELESLLREVIETLVVKEREIEARDGRWYSVRVRPYRTADNKIDGAVVSFVDIDAIRRGLDQARAIVETVREPLVVLDADLHVVTANGSFVETFQVPLEAAERRSLFEIGTGQWNIPQVRTMLEAVLAGHVFEDVEVEHDFERIGKRTMFLNARRMPAATDHPFQILLAIEDVTERKRAEEAIRQLAAIVEGSEESIVGTTLDGLITSWNRGAERMFGYSGEEVLGRPITVMTPGERHDEEIDVPTRIARGEGIHYETVRVRKDGVNLDVSLTVSPIRDAAGRVVGASRILTDITARKRVEHDRAELLEREQGVRVEAEAATVAKDKFLAILSHELRTPLSAMLGWTRLLRSRKLDDAGVARALEVIERNTLIQVRLIEDLLDVSRIVSGTMRVEQRPVMVAPAVNATLATMQPVADAKGVLLESALDEGAGPVRGDPARLQQIVWNLVSNAIKFTPSGGRVDVRLVQRESTVEISIRDTGRGISATQLPQVFSRFGIAHTSTQSQGGMGLGLSIVRHLVELHGGTLQVGSPGPGKGATFTVTLPLTDDRPPSDGESVGMAAGPTSGRLPALKGVRILVVDDEADTRELLRAILVECGAEVTLAASARAALEALERAPFDVLVSDIVMPDENGYDLIRKVRAREAERGGRIPALAVTAYGRIEDRSAAISAGYQQHAVKPIEPAELAAAVATLVVRGQPGPDG
jgi:two-component system, chemotaxis family, CheB/CheR fusion protein